MSNSNNIPKLRPEPPPLPVKAQDVISQGRFNRSLNDEIFYIHPSLMESNEKYRDYLYAIWPEGAVEGDLTIDDTMAAMIIRDYGRTHGISRIANSNLAAIRHSLRVVCKRYAMSRKERREMVGSETVILADEEGHVFPDDNNNGLE